MEILWGDETLFRNEVVFDPDYLPPDILHRELQIADLAACLRPVLRDVAPGHVLCIGPPSTGKTTVVRYVLEKLEEHGVATAYLRCPVLRTSYNVFAKIFEMLSGKVPPQKGVPLFKLLDEIAELLEDEVLVVALDDINFLPDSVLNEVLMALVKSAEFKVGVIAIATSKGFVARLDAYLGSIVHFHEIVFPLYTRKEVEEILRWRVEHGFYPGVMTKEAFEAIVDLVVRNGDIRYGLYLLRRAGLIAERRGSRRIEIEDVERAREGEEVVALAKSIAALNSDEREALKIIYSLDEENITTGDIYAIMRAEVGLYYERFYEIIGKLERLRFIDLVFGRRGRGRTRYVVRRYEPKIILEAIRNYG
ncbi:ORC1-type DNA replication protein [Archaeoglobus sp.]